VTFVARR